MLTMKDIAREAGVSVSAVSYAINGTGSVSLEKKKRVLEIVEKYNYHPNKLARDLKTQVTKTIGVMVDLNQLKLRAKILEAVSHIVTFHGHNMLLVNDTGNHDHAMEILVSARVSGIIYLSYTTKEFVKVFDLDIPIVFAFCYDKSYENASVYPDDVYGGYLATRHLLEQHQTQVATITGSRTLKAVKDRINGYRKAFREFSVVVDPRFIVEGSFDDEARNVVVCRELLDCDSPPRAIFAQSDRIAVSVYTVARELGLRIPHDLSVVGYNDEEYCSYIWPSLSSVSVPVQKIGQNAAEILFSKIEASTAHEYEFSTKIRGDLIVRGSSLA